jgi:hypothetical protein
MTSCGRSRRRFREKTFLTDQLVITGVVLGAAAGSLMAHLREWEIVNQYREIQGDELQEAALNGYTPAVLDFRPESITDGEGHASSRRSRDSVRVSSQRVNNADIGIVDSDLACYSVGGSRSATVQASRGPVR